MSAASTRISLAVRAGCALLRLYRLLAAPVKLGVGFQGCCRFSPTCSHYAEEAIRTHGVRQGLLLALRRLLRCHPWGAFGPDPVPRSLPTCRAAR